MSRYKEGATPPDESKLVIAPLYVPEEHSLDGVRTVQRKYKEGGYEELITASVSAYNEGQSPDVLLMPMIRFIMDASRVGLEQFDTTALGALQHNVLIRADVAANYAIAANRYAMDKCQGLFTRFYQRHPALWTAVQADDSLVAESLTARAYTAGHAVSVYTETSAVAGGAVQFLHQEYPDLQGTEVRNIVIGSDGLRRYGLVPRQQNERRFRTLGLPYVHSRYFERQDTGKVALTAEANDYLRSLRNREAGTGGCPANIIKYTPEPGGNALNAMIEGWQEVASFIVTEEATTTPISDHF